MLDKEITLKKDLERDLKMLINHVLYHWGSVKQINCNIPKPLYVKLALNLEKKWRHKYVR